MIITLNNMTLNNMAVNYEIKVEADEICGINLFKSGSIVCLEDGTKYIVTETPKAIKNIIAEEKRLYKSGRKKTKETDGVVL